VSHPGEAEKDPEPEIHNFKELKEMFICVVYVNLRKLNNK
jgi:hypothetical protein